MGLQRDLGETRRRKKERKKEKFSPGPLLLSAAFESER